MDEFGRQAQVEWRARRASRRRIVWLHAIVWAAVNLMLFGIWRVTGADFPWFVFPLLATAVPLTVHAGAVFVLRGPDDVIHAQEARRHRQLGR
jgi:hypothetical protein